MDLNTQVIVSCRDCGQTRVPVDAVTLRSCLDDDLWSYRFTCEECGRTTVEPTSANRARDALEIGVPLETWRYPSELSEPHDGPPLNLVDLLELHCALIEPDWFDALVRAGS